MTKKKPRGGISFSGGYIIYSCASNSLSVAGSIGIDYAGSEAGGSAS